MNKKFILYRDFDWKSWIFHSFHSWKTPQNNVWYQNSVEKKILLACWQREQNLSHCALYGLVNKKSELDFRVNFLSLVVSEIGTVCLEAWGDCGINTTDDNFEVEIGFCFQGENP